MNANNNTKFNFFEFLKKQRDLKIPFHVKHILGFELTPEERVIDGDLAIGSAAPDVFKYNLPNGLTVKGNFTHFYVQDNTTLPEDLTIYGNFIIYKQPKMTLLPKNLTVYGEFNIPPSIVFIRNDTKLYGRVISTSAFELNLRSLPDVLNINQFSIHRAHSLKTLPKILKVKDSFLIRDSGITYLPENMYVGGYCKVYKCPLTRIGGGLKVGGSLILEDIKTLQEFGPNIEVGKYLDLTQTNVNETNFRDIIPKDIKANFISIWLTEPNKYFEKKTNGRLDKSSLTPEAIDLMHELTDGYPHLQPDDDNSLPKILFK